MSNNYTYELTVASSPHAHGPFSTRRIMVDVLIAMLPALVGAAFFFGWTVLGTVLFSAVCCVLLEWGYEKMMKLPVTVGDCSAAVTGVLLAFVCPPTIPLWALLIGDLFAIVVVKQLFGGIGQNFVNPALAGRAFMMASWAVAMTAFSYDGVTGATPLAAMKGGAMPAASIGNLFVGNIAGCIGETSALLLLVGLLYLVVRKVISLRIPLAFIGTVAVITFLFPQGNDRIAWMASQLFSGGLFLGAIFMATDYATSPVTHWGQVLFGIGCGLLTVFIRYFGSYPEGVSYAILCMNLCVVLLDKVGRPKRFGTAAKKEAAK